MQSLFHYCFIPTHKNMHALSGCPTNQWICCPSLAEGSQVCQLVDALFDMRGGMLIHRCDCWILFPSKQTVDGPVKRWVLIPCVSDEVHVPHPFIAELLGNISTACADVYTKWLLHTMLRAPFSNSCVAYAMVLVDLHSFEFHGPVTSAFLDIKWLVPSNQSLWHCL